MREASQLISYNLLQDVAIERQVSHQRQTSVTFSPALDLAEGAGDLFVAAAFAGPCLRLLGRLCRPS